MHLRFSIRFLWRNWRSGEVKILAISLALAVTVVSAIAIFANRMDLTLARQSNSYLAADRVVEGRFSIPDEWLQSDETQFLEQTQIAEFSSMVYAGKDQQKMHLSSVKAVGTGYPLRGNLEVSDKPFAVGADITKATGTPPEGEVWVDSRLLPLLNLSLGDELTIGNKNFSVSRVVIREPDAGNGFRVLGPRVMINLADLPATGVILPGSRITYRWLLAGEENELKAFESWLEPKLGDHHRLLSLQDAQQNIGSALKRGGHFLMLAAMIGVLLAGVAISIASQQFAQRHTDQVALMKSLGASASQVRLIYLSQLTFLALLASLVGISLGEMLQRIIATSISSFFTIELLPASASIYFIGVATGLVCLLSFALPPLWYLPSISPLKVIRRELTISSVSLWNRGLIGLLALVCLIWAHSGDGKLTFSMVIGLFVITLSTGLLAFLLLSLGQQVGSKSGSVWRLALANLRRYQRQTVTQIIVFSTAFMLLAVLLIVRTSLIDQWRLQLPEDTPNHFVLNIAPHQKSDIESIFKQNQFKTSPMYPMVLGRLKAKNSITYEEKDRNLSNALRRELNLSWAKDLAPDNRIVQGQWWDEWQGKGLGVSVEQDTAEELNINVGDELEFSLGGLELRATVASIRTLDWNAMTPNFYFLFSPGALDLYSPNYLTSLYIPTAQKLFINELLRQYPTIVVLEVDRIIERIQTIVRQVSYAIELVLWLVMAGGVLVLVAAVNASMGSRMQEVGLLRALGSGKRLILGGLCLEFSILGICAGLLAVLGTEGLLFSLQYFVFDQQVSPHYFLWLSLPPVAALLIGLLGVAACRKVIKAPPASVLREVA